MLWCVVPFCLTYFLVFLSSGEIHSVQVRDGLALAGSLGRGGTFGHFKESSDGNHLLKNCTILTTITTTTTILHSSFVSRSVDMDYLRGLARYGHHIVATRLLFVDI